MKGGEKWCREWEQPVQSLGGETKQGRLRTKESSVAGLWGQGEKDVGFILSEQVISPFLACFFLCKMRGLGPQPI